MIFNINSTRGHTGSLLVVQMWMVFRSLYCCVLVCQWMVSQIFAFLTL